MVHKMVFYRTYQVVKRKAGSVWGMVLWMALVPDVSALAAAESVAVNRPEVPSVHLEVDRSPNSERPITFPTWSLSQLIQEALKMNPELTAYQERWRAAKARVWQAMSWDDTMLGADFEGIPRGRWDADRKTNIEWMISQKIPFPGKRFLEGRVAAQRAKMVQADYWAKERELVSEIKKAYFEYFLREHEVLLHEETKRILERLSKSAESQYAVGKVPYHEVLRAHTELATIANEVAKHYQQRDTALARLKFLIGWRPEDSLQIAVMIPQRDFRFSREQLMNLALKHRPELKAMDYGVAMAKTDQALAWMNLLPDGQLRLEARQFRGEGRIREYDQFIGVEVPVFSFLGRVGAVREKRAEKRAARSAWENMKNMVFYEVQQRLAEYESNSRTADLYDSTIVPQAQSIVESALADYEGARGSFLTVMEAQKALTEFRHHYFEALAMREQSFAELERMVGTSLEGGVLS